MKLAGFLTIGTFALLGLYVATLVFATRFLMEMDLPAKVDVIVVLGGDVGPRAAKASALWHQGFAPMILVSGVGDCRTIQGLLVAAGTSSSDITIECSSKDTWENALFSEAVLAPKTVRSGILVTSWYHSKRAIDRFRAVMPNIRWISVPAEDPPSFVSLAVNVDGIELLQEWAKMIFYNMRAAEASRL